MNGRATVTKLKQPDWEIHRKRWSTCWKCGLGEHATNHVLFRGRLPAKVFYIGEAPGPSEDVIGLPFVGRAGKVLSAMIDELQATAPHTFCISNIVACLPAGYDGESFRIPEEREAQCCRPRLEDLIRIANPRRIVLLGETAFKYAPNLDKGSSTVCGIPALKVWHPSYILRKGGVNSYEYRKTFLQLEKFINNK